MRDYEAGFISERAQATNRCIVQSKMGMATPSSSLPPAVDILSLRVSAPSDPPPTVVHHQHVVQRLALIGQPPGSLVCDISFSQRRRFQSNDESDDNDSRATRTTIPERQRFANLIQTRHPLAPVIGHHLRNNSSAEGRTAAQISRYPHSSIN